MSDHWKQSFDSIKTGARNLKETALNRHHGEFTAWHLRARSVLLQYAPVKIPAFDEIRFASDFFLSKNSEEQFGINDRIALSEDLDLALEIFEQAETKIKEEIRYKKFRGDMGKMTIETDPQPGTGLSENPKSSQQTDAIPMTNWSELVESLDLTSREKEEALEELDRVDRSLTGVQHDWDRIKRSIKFLLDFDRTLALKAIPRILEQLK